MKKNAQRISWPVMIVAAWLGSVDLWSSLARADERVSVQPTSVTIIKPGTVIGDKEPVGWSHLLFKNSSSIGAGDLDAATDSLKHLASFLSSTMVAKVEQVQSSGAGTQYVLTDIGYGLYTRVGKSNMVVSSATYKQLGARLGFLDSLALSQAEARLTRLKLTARTSTMSIVDSPTTVLIGGKHEETMVRHAVLVDPRSGNVVTLVWFLELSKRGVPSRVISDIDCIPTNANIEVVLHLDRSLFVLGLVTEQAIALNQMMWGKTQIEMPKDCAALASLERFSAEQLTSLEAFLRAALIPH